MRVTARARARQSDREAKQVRKRGERGEEKRGEEESGDKKGKESYRPENKIRFLLIFVDMHSSSTAMFRAKNH